MVIYWCQCRCLPHWVDIVMSFWARDWWGDGWVSLEEGELEGLFAEVIERVRAVY